MPTSKPKKPRSSSKRTTSRKPATSRTTAAAYKARTLALARCARKLINDKKGINVVIIDVRKASSITDYLIIASGMNRPHVKAMFDEVEHELKKKGTCCYRKVTDHESGWLVLDYVDVVIHILLEEMRSYYAIEDLWDKAPRVK